MAFSEVLERFATRSPWCVMVRGLLESVFASAKMNSLFATHADSQYTRKLFFSCLVEAMTQVVCRIKPSVHAAYRSLHHDGSVSVIAKAFYDKLKGVEIQTSRALVRHTASEVNSILEHFDIAPVTVLPGYDLRIIDGSHPEGTEHRLKVLRHTGAGALPGVVVAVLNPQTRLIEDVVLSADGHAQECTLLGPLLETLVARQLWLGDRHYCTSPILFAINRRRAFFLIRQHLGHLRWEFVGQRRCAGRSVTGVVYEQKVLLIDPETGEEMTVRRISVELDRPTGDGETEIHLLTNVPEESVEAVVLSDVYRQRWQIEGAFQELTVALCCEPNTLGYPAAALFAFCCAIGCYNLLRAMRAAVQEVHGQEEEEEVSGYYMVEEIKETYAGMDIAVPQEEWQAFAEADGRGLAHLLRELASRIKLVHYRKSKRGPKKARQQRSAPREHVSTHRLLHPHLYPAKKKGKGDP